MGVCREVVLGVLAAGVGSAAGDSRGRAPIGGSGVEGDTGTYCCTTGNAGTLLIMIGSSSALDKDEYVEI